MQSNNFIFYKKIDSTQNEIWRLIESKTKTMVKALADLKVEGKTLIVLPENNKNVLMSARNIEGVKTIVLNNINVFDLLKYNNLVLPLETVKKLEEVYA